MRRGTDDPAAEAAIAIVIAGGAVEVARVVAQAAVREVTVVAIPAAVVGAEEGKISSPFLVMRKAAAMRPFHLAFLRESCQKDKRLKTVSGICWTAVMT